MYVCRLNTIVIMSLSVTYLVQNLHSKNKFQWLFKTNHYLILTDVISIIIKKFVIELIITELIKCSYYLVEGAAFKLR